MPYFHVVFTLPHQLSAIVLQNKRYRYELLLRISAETLLEVAANPKNLGAQIGFLSVLHTWGQNLQHHPHVHCVIPAGGLSPDHTRWLNSPSRRFFLSKDILSEVFRGKFKNALKLAVQQRKIRFHGDLSHLADPKQFARFLRTLYRHHWVVYLKPPFGGPKHMLNYLARYTHRVAISNHRLLAFDGENVTFRWKDYAHGNKKRKMTVSAHEFLRRFLSHVLPPGFVRIPHYGFLANRHRSAFIALYRQLIPTATSNGDPSAKQAPSQAHWTCPTCAGPMLIVERLSALQIRFLQAESRLLLDCS